MEGGEGGRGDEGKRNRSLTRTLWKNQNLNILRSDRRRCNIALRMCNIALRRNSLQYNNNDNNINNNNYNIILPRS